MQLARPLGGLQLLEQRGRAVGDRGIAQEIVGTGDLRPAPRTYLADEDGGGCQHLRTLALDVHVDHELAGALHSLAPGESIQQVQPLTGRAVSARRGERSVLGLPRGNGLHSRLSEFHVNVDDQ